MSDFAVLLPNFERYLVCPGCGYDAPIADIHADPQFKFSWRDFKFFADCPECGFSGAWSHRDEPHDFDAVFYPKPEDVEVVFDPYCGQERVVWKIPAFICDKVRDGDYWFLAKLSYGVLRAIEAGRNFVFLPSAAREIK